jgi:DUF971 family protein
MSGSNGQWPTELRLKDGGHILHITFESGSAFDFTAEYLRVMSPSAEVQGHTPQERVTLGGKEKVVIIGVEQVGTYAVRLTFDDLHSTGIYTWDFLYELGAKQAEKWALYLGELKEFGLTRDKPGQRRAHPDSIPIV